MNPKLQKVERDIERTRAKIVELQELLPTLESQKTDLENTEIVKQIRQAHIAPRELNAFVAAYRDSLRNHKSRNVESGISASADIDMCASTVTNASTGTNTNNERSDLADDMENQTD